MDSQGSETTKAETLRFTGDFYLGLKVCQSPLKFDFKLKMALIEFFLIKFWPTNTFNFKKKSDFYHFRPFLPFSANKNKIPLYI